MNFGKFKFTPFPNLFVFCVFLPFGLPCFFTGLLNSRNKDSLINRDSRHIAYRSMAILRNFDNSRNSCQVGTETILLTTPIFL